MRKSQYARALPFAILFGGFALRLYRLGAESLWYDETVSLLLARSDLAELTRHTAGDIHPPFYYFLLHFWGQLAGWSEFSSAFLSLFFGVLLIALVYRVAREWLKPCSEFAWSIPGAPGGTSMALVACFLVAVSPYNVWYSQEVRMYTIGAVLGLLSVYYLLRMLNGPKAVSLDFFAYVIVTAIGLYTLYYLLFLLVFEYVLVAIRLVFRDKGRGPTPGTSPSSPPGRNLSVLRFAASQLAIALLYVPWLPIAFRQATDPPVPPWRSFTPLPNMLGESFSALVLGQSVDPLLFAPFLILILAPILYLFVRPAGRSRPSPLTPRNPSFASRLSPLASRLSFPATAPVSLFLLAYTLVPLPAIFALSLWKPLYHVRYVFTYSPAFYILLAVSICVAAQRLSRQSIRTQAFITTGALAVYVLASGYSLGNFWFDPHYADDDLRGAVQYLAEVWRPGDAILVSAGYAYPALSYYYPTPIAGRLRLATYHPAPDDAKDGPVVLMTGSIDGSPRLGWGDPLSDFYATTAGETTAALDRLFRSHPRVWMLRIYDTVTDPGGVIRGYFSGHGRLIDEQGFTGESNAIVQGFLTGTVDVLPSDAARSNAHLANRLTLLGFESGPAEERGGDHYDTTLYWQPTQTLNLNYQLSLQILDPNGGVIAQHDETPLGNALPTSRWRPGEIYREPVRVQIPQDVPPGEYGIIVKLYNLSSGEVLGEPVHLGSVRVRP